MRGAVALSLAQGPVPVVVAAAVIGPAIQPVLLGDGAEVATPKRQWCWKRSGESHFRNLGPVCQAFVQQTYPKPLFGRIVR
jgi:hypothetical protein